jgi:predicted AAA+ superfamily ATPase
MSFYRTAAGAELDVVVESGQHIIGFEIKFSVAPKVSKGFWQSLKDIQPHKTYIVAPVQQRWPFAEGVEVIPVGDIASVFATPLR